MANQLNRLKFPSLNDKEWEEMKREDVEDVWKDFPAPKRNKQQRQVESLIVESNDLVNLEDSEGNFLTSHF
jgi:hypothetical protein